VVAAFFAREVGSEGARIAAAPTAATPAAIFPAPEGAAVDVAGAETVALLSGAAATAGATVWVCPCGLVIVTILVVLLITTVL
jgi:hypothetical protein